MGPLQLNDLIGLDTTKSIAESRSHAATRGSRWLESWAPRPSMPAARTSPGASAT